MEDAANYNMAQVSRTSLSHRIEGAPGAQREAEIPRELSRLEREVGLTAELAGELAGRLEPFLRIEPVAGEAIKREHDLSTTTSAGARIRELADRLRVAHGVLHRLVQTLEI
jgi:hypothetical protein